MSSFGQILLRPLQPPLEAARHYSFGKLRGDVLAGLTGAVVAVPQAMAYALIAGVAPQYGIYTVIVQGVLGAMFSSSEHLRVGPTNTQSLLIAATVSRLTGSPERYLELVFALTLLKGLIQLVFAAAQMGNMVRYVSRSVMIGVASGAGVLIIVGQLPYFLGIQAPPLEGAMPGVLGSVQRYGPYLTQVNPRALLIGLASLVLIVGLRRASRFIPTALLAIVLSGAAMALLGWSDGRVPVVGALPQGLPGVYVPSVSLSDAESLLGGALALALLGMLESVAIAKTLGTHTGERINANQEFFSQGLTSFISSFFQCIPGSGSFTRSALDHAAGARTRFAAVFNAAFVAIIYLLLAPQAQHVPLSSLAAVLFVIAVGLIDWRYLLRVVRGSRSDAVVCLITFGATLAAPLQYAVFIGVFLNLALYLRQASRLHIAEMVRTEAGPFIERPLRDSGGDQQVMFIQIEGDLFFGVADELQEQLTRLSKTGLRVVIMRLKRTHSIDSTVMGVLEEFTRHMQARGGYVLLCGVKPELMDSLRAFGLFKVIGRDNVFETSFGVFTSAQRALDRARVLLGRSIDTAGLDEQHESEQWAYEI